jgi:hypothetical protein
MGRVRGAAGAASASGHHGVNDLGREWSAPAAAAAVEAASSTAAEPDLTARRTAGAGTAAAERSRLAGLSVGQCRSRVADPSRPTGTAAGQRSRRTADAATVLRVAAGTSGFPSGT